MNKRKAGKRAPSKALPQVAPLSDFPETAEDSEFFVRMFEHEFDAGSRLRKPPKLADVAIVLTSDRWGSDDAELGATLVCHLLVTLAESMQQPKFVFLVGSAAKLAVNGSRCLESLQQLESLGTKIHINKASLEHYHLEGELRVGELNTMMEMLSTLYAAGKVLTF